MIDPQILKLEDKKFVANQADRSKNTDKLLKKLDELKPTPSAKTREDAQKIFFDALKGEPGDKGEKGDPGQDSQVPGQQGEQGIPGKDGIDGTDGKDGVDGLDGKDGIDGKNGFDGKDGKDGYHGIHIWLKKNFGNAKFCEQCGIKGEKINKSWNIHWAKLKGKEYERKRENFWMLCRSCHMSYDKEGWEPWNKGTKGIMKANTTSFKKGQVPWARGRKFTDEHRKNLSLSHIGKKLNYQVWNKGLKIKA